MKNLIVVFCTILLAGCSGKEALDSNIDTLTLSYRIPPSLYESDAAFDSTIKLIRSHHSEIKDFALFNYPRTTYGIFDSVERQQRVVLWEKRMKQFREAGIPRVGLNVWYNLDFTHPIYREWKCPFRQSVDIDGNKNVSVCPNDTAYRKFYFQRYCEYAKSEPDFIWVDEGIFSHCFCDECLKKMQWTQGREALKKALNDTIDCTTRRIYIQFTDNTSNELATIIRDAVHSVNPSIEIGLMTVGYSNFTTNSDNFGRWMRTMGAVKGRPGHGFYLDKEPRLILNKYMDVARQVRDYPSQVKDIEYELENWPYVSLDKSINTVLNESTLAIMAGCTGVAYNIFFASDVPSMSEYNSLHARINDMAPFWNELIHLSQGTVLTGFRTLDTIMLMGNRNVDEKGWFAGSQNYDVNRSNEFMEYGFPFTVNDEGAVGTILSGNNAESFSDDALKKILSGAVMIDYPALLVLWKRGLGNYTGVKPEYGWDHYYEVFTDHPMNGHYKGDALISRMYGAGHKLTILSDKVMVLSELKNYKNEKCGPCYTLYENDLGGRVAVNSMDCTWNDLGRAGKLFQLKNATQWLTKDQVPVRINASLRMAPIIRLNTEKTKFLLALFNMSFDKTGEFTVSVKANVNDVKLVTPQGKENIKFRKSTTDTEIIVPLVEPWSIVIIEGK